jgi:murein DD-endopeptidase MepM/ murein hydrolase activator NlpD
LSNIAELCYNDIVRHKSKGGELLRIKQIKDGAVSALGALIDFGKRCVNGSKPLLTAAGQRLGQTAKASLGGMKSLIRLLKLDVMFARIRKKNFFTDLAPVIVLLTLIYCIFYLEYTRPYQLFVNGQPLAVVSDEETVTEALNDAIGQLTQAFPGKTIPRFEGEFTLSKDDVPYKQETTDKADLSEILMEYLDWTIPAWSIKVEEDLIACVKTKAEAESVLESVKKHYYPNDSTAVEVLDVDFEESVLLAEIEAKPNQLVTVSEATQLLVAGDEKITEYTVQEGDSFWSIAENHGMTVEDLEKMNPDVSTAALAIGQVVVLNETDPLINVKLTLTTVVEEKIPFSTVYEKDSTVWQGQSKTVNEGAEGAKEVTYQISQINGRELERTVVAEAVTVAATDKVVKTGTKVMTVSRGGGGSGQLAWPFRGRITSPYGMRGRSMHTGLDIDGSTGDPILAAEAGTVISAGTNGSYGKCILIDHGDGLVTLYGHLSDYDVSTGDTVSRGQLIGRMGSTGRSTGSHLHLEVRVNGSHKNPLSYLGS